MEKKEFYSKSEADTRKIAREFAKNLKGGEVVCFLAEMGSGKTVFVQEIAAALGYEGYVNSPSYILLNEYPTSKLKIYHYDLYRLSSTDELTEIGFYDFVGDKNNLVLIEWADDILDFIDNQALILITMEITGDYERKIKIEERVELPGN